MSSMWKDCVVRCINCGDVQIEERLSQGDVQVEVGEERKQECEEPAEGAEAAPTRQISPASVKPWEVSCPGGIEVLVSCRTAAAGAPEHCFDAVAVLSI